MRGEGGLCLIELAAPQKGEAPVIASLSGAVRGRRAEEASAQQVFTMLGKERVAFQGTPSNIERLGTSVQRAKRSATSCVHSQPTTPSPPGHGQINIAYIWMPGANRLLANPGLLQSRGCFGCCTKPTPITAVDEPSKRLRIQGRTIRKASLSEDFWSSSAHEMENSAIQSQRSMSSISTAAQSNDQHATGSSSNPNEFVNQDGLKLKHLYLQEMVDLLVDAWEQEGLYD
ncbi:hypothetical protein PR202_ga14992 [Eleusine coracana subsp. coracana]|uniref:DUF4050 domain-containing protein n=1 Tax=Eleusine coracana subsp. coracana TaxID=191504 RepID=A0AAV5CHY5_ELECO|nr:hypothetical protein PR202_ga14992 [Eleusine coracana subsp. coracana]